MPLCIAVGAVTAIVPSRGQAVSFVASPPTLTPPPAFGLAADLPPPVTVTALTKSPCPVMLLYGCGSRGGSGGWGSIGGGR